MFQYLNCLKNGFGLNKSYLTQPDLQILIYSIILNHLLIFKPKFKTTLQQGIALLFHYFLLAVVNVFRSKAHFMDIIVIAVLPHL